jgi:CheY-like chemotaxis protein
MEALEQAAAAGEPVPLVLLDAMMPGVDGFTLAEQIKAHPDLAGAVLLMLSSAARPEDSARCRRLGIALYLTKPVKQSELLDAILTARHAAGVEEQVHAPAAVPPSARPLRVLLAEDNAVNQRLTVGLLSKQGHRVVVANNGREALDALEREPFDLVLMDVQMPEMGGFEAAGAIRKREASRGGYGPGGGRIPVLAMTAHAMKGDRERCLAAGMDGYIAKPVRSEELFRAIGDLRPADGQPPPASPPATAPPAPVEEEIDRDVLMERVGGDAGLLNEVIQVFLDTYPGLLSDLEQAVARRDAPTVYRGAHTLKGVVGNFGVRGPAEVAGRLEALGRAGRLDGAAELYAELAAAVRRMAPALERMKTQ